MQSLQPHISNNIFTEWVPRGQARARVGGASSELIREICGDCHPYSCLGCLLNTSTYVAV